MTRSDHAVTEPISYGPVPTARQLTHHRREFYSFISPPILSRTRNGAMGMNARRCSIPLTWMRASGLRWLGTLA